MKTKLLFSAFILGFIFSANAQWVSQFSGTTNLLHSVSFVTNDLGYIAEENGAILKTINGGSTWAQVSGPHPPNGIIQIQFTSIDTGFAISWDGILKTNNGGISWQNKFTDSAVAYTWWLSFPTPTIGYAAVGSLGMDSTFLYKTIDAGNTWSKIFSTSSFDVPSLVYFTDPNTGFMLIDTAICKTINGGISWVAVPSLTAGSAMDFPSGSVGYAVGDLGTVLKTTDSGNTWTPQTTPTTYTLYSVSFTSIDTGYAVGGNGFSGVIIKTVDGGSNWTIDATASQSYLSVDFPSASVGYTCGDNGVIYKRGSATGIQDNTEGSELTIFPNPSNGIFTLQFSDP